MRVNINKANVLRETVGKVSAACKRDLDGNASQTIENASDVGVVLDYVAGERLRVMPQSGSRYDKVLRWAEVFVMHVETFSQNCTMANVIEATQQIFGCTHLILQVRLTNGRIQMSL